MCRNRNESLGFQNPATQRNSVTRQPTQTSTMREVRPPRFSPEVPQFHPQLHQRVNTVEGGAQGQNDDVEPLVRLAARNPQPEGNPTAVESTWRAACGTQGVNRRVTAFYGSPRNRQGRCYEKQNEVEEGRFAVGQRVMCFDSAAELYSRRAKLSWPVEGPSRIIELRHSSALIRPLGKPHAETEWY